MIAAETAAKAIGKAKKGSSGTRITFLRDESIFDSENNYRFATLLQRFREMAFVTRGVTIQLVDERSGREMTFYFEGGIKSFVRYLNRNRKTPLPLEV